MKNSFKLMVNTMLCVSIGLTPAYARSNHEESTVAVEISQQQTRQITGTVTDVSTGEPLIGVTILVKGTQKGVVSDMDGRFSISVANGETLEISYTGFKKQSITITSQRNISIEMEPDNEILDDLVVIGYGTVKKSDLTGAVASANLKDFKNAPNTNVIQSLQGTVPGLNIGQVTTAGATPSISVRGTNTLNGSSDVLIVLDGIIYTNQLGSLNPNDIESIDVLKDASATAVYGAQAANGVLLITTKRGKAGKTKVEFSTSYSVSNPTKNIRPCNREEFLSFTRESWYDEAFTGPDYHTPNPSFDILDKLNVIAAFTDPNQPDGISANDYDWWGEGTRTGSIQENRLSISGGNDAASYLISLENATQHGFILNDDFQRNSVRVNLDANPYKWLKTGVQAFGSFLNRDGAEPGLYDLIIQSPLITPYDEDGNIKPYPFNTLDVNPFMASSVNDRERYNTLFANLYAEIKLPLKGLTYRVNFGNNFRIVEKYQSNEYGSSLAGQAFKRHTSYYDWTLDNIINYNNTFGDHSVAATFVYGASQRENSYTEALVNKFSRLSLGYNALQLGEDQYANSSAWKENLLYQMFRVNYSYKGLYMLTATVRRDGFSGFSENNKSAIFPSVALGWNISNEKWFKAEWVNNLKLRGGWGISGNQTSRYASQAKMTTQAGYIFGDGGSTENLQKVSSMGNSNLKWEKTAGVNLGIDFGLWENRITGSLEIYNTTTNDLLYNMTLPSVTGFTGITTNLGKIKNKGIEFSITSHNITTKDFDWTTTFNISHNSNKIVTLLGKDNDGDGKEDDLIASNLFIGQPIGTIYGYQTDGIWQLGDDIMQGYYPGTRKVIDQNGDGTITTDDRIILGHSEPAYRFGILNTFRYKDFSLSFFINSIQGGKNGYMTANSPNILRGNQNDRVRNIMKQFAEDLWSPNNPDATFARYITQPSINGTRYQQRNFIRLQDITLGYNLPKSILKKTGIDNVNIYLSGKNLITISDWKGWDPETASTFNGRPVMRSYTIGLNVTI